MRQRSSITDRGPRLSSALLMASVSLALIATACSSNTGTAGEELATGSDDVSPAASDTSPESDTEPKNLVVATGQEPSTYDHTVDASGGIKVLLHYNVVEPLLEYVVEDASLAPLLAESYDVSEDGREYTFALREATFHDGSDLSADDVVYSLERARKATNTSISEPLQVVDKIDKIDERHVQVTLSKPSRGFLNAMAGASGWVLPEGIGDDFGTAPVGTGPFVFEEWNNGVDVELKRFEDYWGDEVSFDSVTWRFITDGPAAVDAILAGDVDALEQVFATERIEEIEAAPGLTVHSVAGREGGNWMFLNATSDKFSDERVRQAIAHAIDRDAIIEGIDSTAKPSCTWDAPDTTWSTDYCPYSYDPEKSRQLLAAAGAEGLTIEIKPIIAGNISLVGEIVASQLEAVGIKTKLAPLETATWLEEVGTNADFELAVGAGVLPLETFTCPGWFMKDCVAEFDSLLEESDAATDPDEWARLRREAVELFADRAYMIPLTHAEIITAARDELAGVKPGRSETIEFDLRDLRWAD